MIPLKDQEFIREKFAQELVFQVKVDLFTQRDLGLDVPGRTPCQFCKLVGELLHELAGLSDLISLRVHYFDENPPEKAAFGVERIPAIVLRQGETIVKYYGMPGGTEFPAFVESIVDLSRRETLLSPESVATLQALPADVYVKVFVTPTCQYCPGMLRAGFLMAMASPRVHTEAIEVNEFPDLADRYNVQAVPLTVINDRVAIPGMVHESVIVREIAKAAEAAGSANAAASPSARKIERGKTHESGLYIP